MWRSWRRLPVEPSPPSGSTVRARPVCAGGGQRSILVARFVLHGGQQVEQRVEPRGRVLECILGRLKSLAAADDVDLTIDPSIERVLERVDRRTQGSITPDGAAGSELADRATHLRLVDSCARVKPDTARVGRR